MLLTLGVGEQSKQDGEYGYAKHDAAAAVAVEGYSQQCHGQEERDVHSHPALLPCGLPDGPQHGGHEQYDVYYQSRIEVAIEFVDEEQFKPSANLDDARHDAVQDGCYQDAASHQRQQCPLGGGILAPAVVVYQHECGQAEQVEQVNPDAQSR